MCTSLCGSRTVRIMCVFNHKRRAAAALLHHCGCDQAPNGRGQMADAVRNNYKPLCLKPLECNILYFKVKSVNTMLCTNANDPSRILQRWFKFKPKFDWNHQKCCNIEVERISVMWPTCHMGAETGQRQTLITLCRQYHSGKSPTGNQSNTNVFSGGKER